LPAIWIRVEPIDLAPARRVFLVSPTWLFRPAPPLWAYVEQVDLAGKDVVLVMIGNSRYKQDEIDAFARRVEAHGGRLIRHLFLRRGRIFWQKSREEPEGGPSGDGIIQVRWCSMRAGILGPGSIHSYATVRAL
jgi:hypothetical protein